MAGYRALVFVLLLAVVAPRAGAAEGDVYLEAIRFEGNARTQESVMLQEMRVRPMQWVSPADIEASRQAVMDLGLFQWVRSVLEESEKGQVLVITVKEKYYLLPVPILDGDPQTQDVTYGLELRVDNIAGLNQRLKLVYEHEDSTSEVTPASDEYKASYSYPRLLGTPYTLSVDTRLLTEEYNAIEDGDVVGRYDREVLSAGVHTSRWMASEGPSAGWRGGTGLSYTTHKYDYVSGTPGLYEDARSVSVDGSFGRSEVHDHGYYLSGAAYGWNGSLGLPGVGSDFAFTRHMFYMRLYRHLAEQNANINWQLRVGFADGHVFGSPAYSIGGFTTLRGYETSAHGNGLALSNLEYHKQIDGLPSLRGVAFLDLGNVYPEVVDMEPGDMEAGVGVGVRWHLQFLVDVTISADLGYGLGPGTTVGYLTTHGSF